MSIQVLLLSAVQLQPASVETVGSFVSKTGSWAVFYATVFLALALFFAKKAPWPALVLLVGFGWELQESHTMPHGPMHCWRLTRRCAP